MESDPLFGIADKSDMMLAVIETQRDAENMQEESHCRLYEVGAVKTDEELVRLTPVPPISLYLYVSYAYITWPSGSGG